MALRERTGYAMVILQAGLFAGVSVSPLLGEIAADTLGYREVFLVTGGSRVPPIFDFVGEVFSAQRG